MWFANLRRAGVLCYIRTSFLSPLICLPSHTGKKNNWETAKSLSLYIDIKNKILCTIKCLTGCKIKDKMLR